ncbi:MAG: hypothetical protein JSS66_09935 [Armatimonadetes bacterium]|nr:hypothetical protein [Armatimonadota bacterium]
MRTCLVVILCGFTLLAVAQEAKLGVPTFAAQRATVAEWNPEETCMAYGWQDKEGPLAEVGVYNTLTGKGKVLWHPALGERVEQAVWTAGRPVRILSTVQEVAGRAKPTVLRSIYALDAVTLEARKLWSQEFEKDGEVSLEIDTSPSLAHAVVTLYSKAGNSIYALVLGATGLVFSRDATASLADGSSFSGWSKDGTAIFGKQNAFFLNRQKLELDLSQFVAAKTAQQNTIVLDGKALTEDFAASGVKIRFRLQPNYEMGASVLEMVPGNGALRPVKFRGYFEEKETGYKFQWLPKPEQLKYEQSWGQTNSLWLAEAVENPQRAILVAPQAEAFWPAPRQNAVAYTVNSVLFFRTVTR